MKLTRVLAALLIIQVGLVIAGLVRWNGPEASGSAELLPVVVQQVTLPMTPENGQALAQSYADQWEQGAVLVSASMRMRWDETQAESTSIPDDGYLTYIYIADGKTLSLIFDRRSGLKLGDTETSYGEGEWKPLELGSYRKTSTIAAITADLVAGNAYRVACPANRTSSIVSASIATLDSGERVPVWTVTYSDKRNGDAFDVRVRMDAVSGNVIDNSTRDRDCD